jgi:alpha-L-fucosidase
MLTSGVENAGMKYLTIIGWHHEGFQMYGWTPPHSIGIP